jgi:hypothetical protein
VRNEGSAETDAMSMELSGRGRIVTRTSAVWGTTCDHDLCKPAPSAPYDSVERTGGIDGSPSNRLTSGRPVVAVRRIVTGSCATTNRPSSGRPGVEDLSIEAERRKTQSRGAPLRQNILLPSRGLASSPTTRVRATPSCRHRKHSGQYACPQLAQPESSGDIKPSRAW